jgi:hypothetical protein
MEEIVLSDSHLLTADAILTRMVNMTPDERLRMMHRLTTYV